jgi:integrase
MKNLFNDIVLRYHLAKRPITSDAIKSEFLDPDSSVSFLAFFKNRLEKRYKQNRIVASTVKQHKVTFNHLRAFNKYMTFGDINIDFIYNFENYLITPGNNKGAISTRMKNLQVYLLQAVQEGLLEQSPIGKGKYKIPGYSTRVIAHTLQERKLLLEYFFSPEISSSHYCVLQGYLLSCYTGLRYSDLSRVSHADITNQKILSLKPRKTIRYNKKVEIPIIDIVFRIVEKKGRLCRKIIQNQPTNSVLKEIGLYLGIETSMTTHVGRHTFGSLFIQSGGNVATLQKLMAHSNIKETMVYVHLHETYIVNEMKNFGNIEL